VVQSRVVRRWRDLAFMGGLWILMAPPVQDSAPKPILDVRAPVSSWRRIATYPSGLECEQDRLELVATAWKAKNKHAEAQAATSRCYHVDQLRRLGVGSGGVARVRAEPTEYDGLIREAADMHQLEYALVKAVIRAESDFDRLAVSPKGARGLMQLMPATASDYRVRNSFVPRDNISAGCRHLRMLLDRYGGSLELALAAYNAGIRRVDECGGVPPILETQEYLERVLRYRRAYLVETARAETSIRMSSRQRQSVP
jgi:soluble lytic murein transglycosylase-like protein